jgi:hypothetical protein
MYKPQLVVYLAILLAWNVMESPVRTVPVVCQVYIYTVDIVGMFVHSLHIQIQQFHNVNLVMVIAIFALDLQWTTAQAVQEH